MKVDVYNMQGEKVKKVDLPAEIFEAPINVDLMHQAYVQQMANARLGTHKTKTRAEVSGGGRKPWRQKGTGRARAGSRRSPLWRGGGVIFGPKPRDYGYTLPKKVRSEALRVALSDKLNEEKLLVIRDFGLSEIKTAKFAQVLGAYETKSVLIVTSEPDEALELSSRNVPNVKVMRAEGLNVYDILRHDNLMISETAVAAIEERLS